MGPTSLLRKTVQIKKKAEIIGQNAILKFVKTNIASQLFWPNVSPYRFIESFNEIGLFNSFCNSRGSTQQQKHTDRNLLNQFWAQGTLKRIFTLNTQDRVCMVTTLSHYTIHW